MSTGILSVFMVVVWAIMLLLTKKLFLGKLGGSISSFLWPLAFAMATSASAVSSYLFMTTINFVVGLDNTTLDATVVSPQYMMYCAIFTGMVFASMMTQQVIKDVRQPVASQQQAPPPKTES